MLRNIKIWCAIVAIWGLLIPGLSYASPQLQETCGWYDASVLNLAPEYNQYADIVPTEFVKFRPTHIYGDQDFHGNGPHVTAETTIHISREGMSAYVHMRAKETRADWTTAEGSSGELWFVHFKSPWTLRSVGVADYDNGSLVVVPDSIIQIDNGGGNWWGLELLDYVDNGHGVDVFPADQHDARLIDHIEVIGDTNGKEAGNRTGISIYTKVTAFELCQ